MLVNIAAPVISKKTSKFGFWTEVDKSTDVTSNGQLLVHGCYTQDNSVKTELLMNKELSGTTKGKSIFKVLDQG